MLCADLIEVRWLEGSGQPRQAVANLEDISSAGVCLQLDAPVADGVLMHIHHENVEFAGRVRYCIFRDTGYFIGVQFEEGFQWDANQYKPKHLLDPRTLVDPDPPPAKPWPPVPPAGKVQ